jgi:exonuclease SbcC
MPDDTQLMDTPETAAADTAAAPPDSAADTTGAWPKDAQAEFTKKSQTLADERRQFEGQRQQWQQQQQYLQQQQQMQQQQAQTQQRTQGQQQQQTQLLDQLREMSYLDGPTAAQVIERLITEGINPLHQAIQKRDQALTQMYQEHKALRDQMGTQTTKVAQSDLDQRFAKARADHALPDEPWVNEYLQDVYYSHEGTGLNDQYGTMVQGRLEAMRKGMRELDRQAATKAKATSPFPTKGGEVAITDGKTGGYKTPQDRANELWPMLNPGTPE